MLPTTVSVFCTMSPGSWLRKIISMNPPTFPTRLSTSLPLMPWLTSSLLLYPPVLLFTPVCTTDASFTMVWWKSVWKRMTSIRSWWSHTRRSQIGGLLLGLRCFSGLAWFPLKFGIQESLSGVYFLQSRCLFCISCRMGSFMPWPDKRYSSFLFLWSQKRYWLKKFIFVLNRSRSTCWRRLYREHFCLVIRLRTWYSRPMRFRHSKLPRLSYKTWSWVIISKFPRGRHSLVYPLLIEMRRFLDILKQFKLLVRHWRRSYKSEWRVGYLPTFRMFVRPLKSSIWLVHITKSSLLPLRYGSFIYLVAFSFLITFFKGTYWSSSTVRHRLYLSPSSLCSHHRSLSSSPFLAIPTPLSLFLGPLRLRPRHPHRCI